MASRFPELSESDLTSSLDQKNSDRMIKQLCDPTPPPPQILKLSANQVVRIRLTVTPPCKLESWSFVGCIVPVRNECEVIYEIFHILNCGCQIK